MKTIETTNYVIHIDKFIDLIYVEILTKEHFVSEVLDNIMLFQKTRVKQ